MTRLLVLSLSLVLWRGAVGGRDADDDSVAVDTGAHFQRSGFSKERQDLEELQLREAAEAGLSQTSRHRAQRQEEASGESEVIEQLGRQIAKQLAHELHGQKSPQHAPHERHAHKQRAHDDGPGAAEIETATHLAGELREEAEQPGITQKRAIERHRQELAGQVHSGLLEKLAKISHALDTASSDTASLDTVSASLGTAALDAAPAAEEKVPTISHSAAGSFLDSSESAGVMEMHRSADESQSASAAKMADQLESFSQVLDTASAQQKLADKAARKVLEKSDKYVDAAQPTLQDWARFFQSSPTSFGKPASMLQAAAEKMEMNIPSSIPKSSLGTPLQTPVSERLMPRPLKHGQGLDAVAGDLLQLKAAMVHQQKVYLGGGPPSWADLDKDHNGSVSMEEWKAAFGGDEEEAEAIFKKISKNGDGKFDEEEYQQALKDGIVPAGNVPRSGAFRPYVRGICTVFLSLVFMLA